MNPIQQISEREFEDNEFKAGFKEGHFQMYGTFRKKDIKQHFQKARDIFN